MSIGILEKNPEREQTMKTYNRYQINTLSRNELLVFYEDNLLQAFAAFTGDYNHSRIHAQLLHLFLPGKKYLGHWHSLMTEHELRFFLYQCIDTLYTIGGSLDPEEYPDYANK